MLIRTYAWLIMLDPGFATFDVLRWLHIAGENPEILFTSKAVYIGVVYTYLPLMVLPIYAALSGWTGHWSRLPRISATGH